MVQYELQLQKGLECGGAYLKLLTANDELKAESFNGDTPYTIMFGVDRCGSNHKLHFILRHQSPIDGSWKECHMSSPFVPSVSDKKSHLYTAIVTPDNKVRILVDGKEEKVADLLSKSDFRSSVNPEKVIDDPTDSKPGDWVRAATAPPSRTAPDAPTGRTRTSGRATTSPPFLRYSGPRSPGPAAAHPPVSTPSPPQVDSPKMPDPLAAKPDDWDEDAPLMIDDPEATKPAAWEDDAPLRVRAHLPGRWRRSLVGGRLSPAATRIAGARPLHHASVRRPTTSTAH